MTVIKAGRLFDSETGRVSRDRVIVVEGEKITAVGGSGTAIPEGAIVIDLSDSFVLPGVMPTRTWAAETIHGEKRLGTKEDRST